MRYTCRKMEGERIMLYEIRCATTSDAQYLFDLMTDIADGKKKVSYASKSRRIVKITTRP